jgi:hypothetical protein
MIFLMATEVPESWSFAELNSQHWVRAYSAQPLGKTQSSTRKADVPDETESSHSNGLKVDISRRDLENGSKDGELDEICHTGGLIKRVCL